MLRQLVKSLKGDGLKAQLLRGSGGSALVQASNILLTLAGGVLLARTLGPDGYGTYAFVMSIITLLSLPAKAGLPTLLIREIAKSQVESRWGAVRGILSFSNGLAFCYSMLAAALASAWILYHMDGGVSQTASVFLWGVWLLPLLALEATRTATLRGLRWVVSGQLPEKVLRPAIMITLLGSAVLLGAELDADVAIQFQLLAAFAAFLLGAFLLIKAMPGEVNQAVAEYSLKPWFASLLPLTLFVGLKMLDSQIAIIFLGFLSPPEDVGLFRVAVTGAALVTFALTAVNMALAPQIARLYHAGEKEKLQRVITLSVRGVFALSFPIALVLIIWGEPIISLVFGPEYAGASTALAVLCFGQLINVSAGSVGAVLNMSGNDKIVFYGAVLALTVNVSLALLLIPSLSLLGAALSFAISISVWNIFLSTMARSRLGIHTFLKIW